MEKKLTDKNLIKTLQIELINKDKIKPFKDNPRLHSDDQIKQIANSIKEFGFRVPLAVDEDFTILAGHGRYKAAVSMGMVEMPVVQHKDLSPAQKKAFVIADNKITLNSTWQENLLWEQIKSLDELGFNLNVLGFDNAELLPMLDDNTVTDFASEWEGMPDYESEDVSAYRTIRVHFESDRDVEVFAKLVKQKITDKTKFIWHPQQENLDAESQRYD